MFRNRLADARLICRRTIVLPANGTGLAHSDIAVIRAEGGKGRPAMEALVTHVGTSAQFEI
jgi:hypothetical protein